MIIHDVTKAAAASHRSGLVRVSSRLGDGLGEAATSVRWPDWDRAAGADDWFLTGELFSEEERPGFTAFLGEHRCRTAAIFHDAIPLRHPHITWPQSVARHPGYMKLLAQFDRVWAVSAASREELIGFWQWQGVGKIPPVEVLALGADFDAVPRALPRVAVPEPSILCLGILEPRKNQAFLLDACELLWSEGLAFELHLVGRVNPHFGAPLLARVKSLRRKYPALHYHAAAGDAEVAEFFETARVTAFPTLAEGCGLPLLESLWKGVPCVCSDLPVLRENADGGGCVAVAPNNLPAWREALRSVLTDDAQWGKLTADAASRALPTWGETARTILRELGARA